MNASLIRILRNLAAVLGLGLFGLSVARLLWPGAGEGKGSPAAWRRAVADAPEVEAGVVGGTIADGAEDEPEPADSGELVVVLDPGHGGSDPGSVRDGHYEKDINLAVARRVGKLLESGGVRVVMTRSEDVTLELQERVAVANRYRNAIFVSIHQNASVETEARGVETYFAWPRPASVVKAQRERYGIPAECAYEDERGQILAAKVLEAFCAETRAPSRGTKNRNFVVIRWVHGPAVLVECGFLSNPAERERLLSDAYRDKVAKGIADGLRHYARDSGGDARFGLRFPNGAPPVKPGPARRTVVQALPADR